jgi:hypothetical protein
VFFDSLQTLYESLYEYLNKPYFKDSRGSNTLNKASELYASNVN